MTNIYKILLALFLAMMSFSVFGANVHLEATPTSWKLQNYVGNNVVAFYTGSSCTYGKINFGTNATEDDKKRFWSLIMSAKIASKQVQVYYENAGAPENCYITSFSLLQE